MKQKLAIIKIGGNVIENKIELSKFLNLFAKFEGYKILIHGGGKLATQLAHKLGITSKMIAGRRITDTEMLEIITMVYAGLINKKIVAELQANNCNAIGLSGADGNTIKAHKRPVKDIDYGFVGDIDTINHKMITTFLSMNLIPVFCAMSHNQNGQLLNTNADTIAAELAIGLSEFFDTTLYYCFEKKGVLRNIKNDESLIKYINSERYSELITHKIITDGMLPKLENCFHALKKNVNKVCLGDIYMLDRKNDLYTTLTL